MKLPGVVQNQLPVNAGSCRLVTGVDDSAAGCVVGRLDACDSTAGGGVSSVLLHEISRHDIAMATSNAGSHVGSQACRKAGNCRDVC